MWIVLLVWLAALLLGSTLLVEISVSVGRPTALRRCLRLPVFGGYARPLALSRSTGSEESRTKTNSSFRRALTRALLEQLSWQRPQLVRGRRSLTLYLRARISGKTLLVILARTLWQQLQRRRQKKCGQKEEYI